MDALLDQQAAAADPAARTKVVGRLQQELTANSTTIPVAELTTVLGISSQVQGVAYDASSRVSLFDAWKAA